MVDDDRKSDENGAGNANLLTPWALNTRGSQSERRARSAKKCATPVHKR